ncbi:O-GlcNAcase [Aphomia sociella]
MTECSPDEPSSNRKDFICGVVEGFYGRPWTTEQRKDLFQKLKKWGMDMYVYAPKDDYKHRAYWRELYTVEEAEHLTSLISAAKSQGIIFCYALSPGLDITYSSQKEITTLKRKLEQVYQFGCTCFALLFDDIEPEMSEADKQIFQSFAHAQVSVTNEIHQHLGCPRFLLCPTQYCSTRAVPTVNSSEYLNTLGTKLSQQIDIMWTGPKVISKTLTTECIEEITQVLRRPPVIWDNLHANDYDQKRIFLGPYCGRSPELIPLLRGVLTNPNCEYNANMIPIWTLAHWASCSLDAPAHMEAVSWDIKLERESEQGVCDDEAPLTLGKHVYHHRQALRHAINEWLPEFSIPKTAQGPIIKPQPSVTAPPVAIVPIMPSVNTCMSLVTATSTTCTTSTAAAIPTVHTSQLQAASADRPILSTGISSIETFNPVSNPVMNSLVSPTKVILNESIPNPIIPMASSNMSLPSELPVSTLPVPILGIKALEDSIEKPELSMSDKLDETISNDSVLESASFLEDIKRDKEDDTIIVDEVDAQIEEQQRNGTMSIGDTPQTLSPNRPSAIEGGLEPLDVDPPSAPITDPGDPTDPDVIMNDGTSENGSMQVEPSNSPLSTDMMVEPAEPTDVPDESGDTKDTAEDLALSADDLVLLCDAFYLPFEHGSRGLRLLHDFHWLACHAASMLPRPNKPQETSEWVRRRARFAWWTRRARRLARRLGAAANRELHAELQPYVWELCAVLALLDGFVRWLELGKFPPNIATYTQGTYTWFSKGWRCAFESGAQEPWVFRGGLAADLRRLLPVEGGAELPAPPAALPLQLRPYAHGDDDAVCAICHKTCRDGSDCSDLFPSDLQTLPADRLVAPFLTLTPELCMVIEDDHECTLSDCDNPDEADDYAEKRRARINGAKPEIVGYACAALNSKEFYKRQEIAWIPEMCNKYPESLMEREDLSQAAKDCIWHFHQFARLERAPDSVTRSHPALLTCCVLPPPACRDPLAPARLLTCLLAALRAHGASGVHACINATDHYLHQFYSKLGFVEVHRGGAGRVYLARSF